MALFSGVARERGVGVRSTLATNFEVERGNNIRVCPRPQGSKGSRYAIGLAAWYNRDDTQA